MVLARRLRLLAVVVVAGCASGSAASRSVPTNTPRLREGDLRLAGALLEVADARRPDTVVIDQALRSPSSIVRAYGARVAGQNGVRTRAAALRALVAESDSAVAADAAFALGLLRDSAAVSLLATALAGPPTVATAAAWSLGELGEVARPALLEVLRTGQPAAALVDALHAAAKLRPVPASAIGPYLAHPDVVVRRSATYAVTRSRVPAASFDVLALARRVATPGEPGAGATDVETDLRSYLARGLAKPNVDDSLAPAALRALQRLVDDPHPHVRVNAIRALATFGRDATADLLRHLRDPDANARVTVAQSLGGILSDAAEWEEAWRADTGFTYRRSLLTTAARAGVRLAAIDPVASDAWQRRPDWRFRAAAAEASVKLADIDAIAVPLLRDPDPRVRSAAYSAAAPWTDSALAAAKPYGRLALRSALGDSDMVVRARILGALRARATTADIGPALDAWRRAARDPENDARLAALRVLVAAWRSDSGSFGPWRDSLVALAAPPDPLERDLGRGISPLRHWPAGRAAPRPPSWYLEQARTTLARGVSGRKPRATIATVRGTITLVLESADAPLTVDNFVRLARRGYYDGLAFHRVVPNFVVQDGDPRGDGSGGPGYAIRDELNRRWYDRGAVGMALSGPDTGGSQYFIAHSPQPHLDGHYTVFGHVMAGLDVLDALVQGDRILSVTIR